MLPLPSIFHPTAPNMMFGGNGSSSLLGSSNNSPSFLLPGGPLHQGSGMFSPHDPQQYPDMPSMVDYQIHSQQPTHTTHYNQHFQPTFQQYSMMFTAPTPHHSHHQPQPQPHHQHHSSAHGAATGSTNHVPSLSMTMPSPTPSKGKRRAPREEEKKDPNAPNTIPKCTRCNENASWRHDKRRWWCKECKKAFTPGISKMQNVQNISSQIQSPQIPQTIPSNISIFQAGMMSPGIPSWDSPSSSQSTPTTIPQSISQSSSNGTAPCCPFCKGISSWKHDKKRWYCKECKKPFTPTMSSQSPNSPVSPGGSKGSSKKSSSKAKKTVSTPLINNSLSSLPISPASLLPSAHLQSPLQINPPFQQPPFSPITTSIIPNLKPELNLSPPRSHVLSNLPSGSQTLSLIGGSNSILSSSSLGGSHILHNSIINNNSSPLGNHHHHNSNSNSESSLSSLISGNSNSNNSNSNGNNESSSGNGSLSLSDVIQNSDCNSPKKTSKKNSILVNVDNSVLNANINVGDNSNNVHSGSDNWNNQPI